MRAVNNLHACSFFVQNECDNQFSDLHSSFILSPCMTNHFLICYCIKEGVTQ